MSSTPASPPDENDIQEALDYAIGFEFTPGAANALAAYHSVFEIERYLGRDVVPGEVCGRAARTALYVGDRDAARAWAADGLRRDSSSPRVQRAIGILAFNDRDFESAAAAFERATADEDEDERRGAFADWRESLHGLGRHDDALATFQLQMPDGPVSADDWFAFTRCHLLSHRGDDALRTSAKAVELDPEDALVHYQAACVQSLYGDRAIALEHVREALDIDPEQANAIEEDDDLVALRDDPEFQRLIEVNRIGSE